MVTSPTPSSAGELRVPVRGAGLVVRRSGRGPTLLWGHGLTSSMAAEDESDWLEPSAWSSFADVVRYDARGHGGSDSTPDLDGYHWRELALDQLALADALDLDAYVAGGASMGAATALHAAVVAPQRVRALVLMIPPTAWATRAAQQDVYETSARLIEAGAGERLIAAAAANPPPDPFAGTTDWHDRYARTVRDTDPSRLARVLRGAARTDLPEPSELASIAVPALVLAWTGDAGHPVSSAERLGELLPDVRVRIASSRDDVATWADEIEHFVVALG